jgi:hypothetical protein
MGLNNFTTSTGAADFTDVNLDSANFPSGFTIDEDNGDLVVRDTTGTVALRRVDGGNWSFAGNTVEANQLGTSSQPVDLEARILDTDQATVRNETLVSVSSNTNQSVAANNVTVVQLDQVKKDERNEFDTANFQFSPDETGFYQVHGSARVDTSSDGDRVTLNFDNVSGPTSLLSTQRSAGRATANRSIVSVSGVIELNSSESFELKANDIDSSATVVGVDSATFLTIRSVFR